MTETFGHSLYTQNPTQKPAAFTVPKDPQRQLQRRQPCHTPKDPPEALRIRPHSPCARTPSQPFFHRELPPRNYTLGYHCDKQEQKECDMMAEEGGVAASRTERAWLCGVDAGGDTARGSSRQETPHTKALRQERA